jgi:hypothetical protein
MPTIDDVYRKFGDASEAAQLLETELGNALLELRAVEHDLLNNPKPDLAGEILKQINRSTLGSLLRNLTEKTSRFEKGAELLANALAERNRLAHSFYRQHNFRRNSEDGRAVMLADLEEIHSCILQAYEMVLLLGGVDLGALQGAALPTRHLKI